MNIILSNSSGEPIYSQIVTQIKNMIMFGQLKENELLPSIRNLAKELQISVITTKRAYEELERDGFIYSIPGKGSFVTAQSKQLLDEVWLKIIEEKLSEAADAARMAGISIDELIDILKMFYEEEQL